MTTGSWSFDLSDAPRLHLRTRDEGIPTLDASAPIVAGALSVTAKDVDVHIELSLAKLKSGNFLMQGAARALIKRYDGDRLAFTASSAATSAPWAVAGMARAGTVEIPMEVTVTPVSAAMSAVVLGGIVTMEDVAIPLPGLSGIRSISFDIDSRVGILPA